MKNIHLIKEQLLHTLSGMALGLVVAAVASALDIGSHALLKLGVSQFTYIAIALLAHCMMVVDLVLFSIYLVTSSKALIKEMLK